MLSWPRKDQISWVEWELLRAKRGSGGAQSPLVETPIDLEVWLARERDGKSWREIGDVLFPKSKVEARRSEARRAYARVHEYMKGDPKGRFREHTLKELIEETFGVSAQDFRTFILKGRLPRRK